MCTRTHTVAVNAYLIHEDRFLLLKRSHPPRIWTPPGGHLQLDEDPVKGLEREVREETGLSVQVLTAVNSWFGSWKNQPLLAIDYLAKVVEGSLRLSSEHEDARWVSWSDLLRGEPVSLDSQTGFTVTDFEYAWRLKDSLFKDHF